MVTLVLILYSCKDYKSEINALSQRIAQLEQENANLKEEIRKLRETDQNYFNTAVDLFNEGRYEQSIEKFKEMKSKFPSSQLVAEAEKK
jgi:TolA-binding protein